MVISNQLNGPFSRAHVFTIMVTMVLAVSVFIGLASLSCVTAAQINQDHGCVKSQHSSSHFAQQCQIPNTGAQLTVLIPLKDLVSFEIAFLKGSSLRVVSSDAASQTEISPAERPPQLI